MKRLYDDTAWTTKDQEIIDEHFLRIKNDYQKGAILHVGRTKDPVNNGFGMVVFSADDEETARNYMMQDPAVSNNLMTASLHEYILIFNN